jgi:hypothetical protein
MVEVLFNDNSICITYIDGKTDKTTNIFQLDIIVSKDNDLDLLDKVIREYAKKNRHKIKGSKQSRKSL